MMYGGKEVYIKWQSVEETTNNVIWKWNSSWIIFISPNFMKNSYRLIESVYNNVEKGHYLNNAGVDEKGE